MQLSLRIDALRRERDDVARRISNSEAELDAALYGTRVDASEANQDATTGRESAFTRRVFYILRQQPETSVQYLVVQTGHDGDPKRVHNALRTLERKGRAERVGRGRWRALQLPVDQAC